MILRWRYIRGHCRRRDRLSLPAVFEISQKASFAVSEINTSLSSITTTTNEFHILSRKDFKRKIRRNECMQMEIWGPSAKETRPWIPGPRFFSRVGTTVLSGYVFFLGSWVRFAEPRLVISVGRWVRVRRWSVNKRRKKKGEKKGKRRKKQHNPWIEPMSSTRHSLRQ